MTASPDLGSLVQETADRLAKQRVGVVVGALAGDSVEVRGVGRLNREREIAPDGDTMFEIGSVTKVFTGLALARLAVAGTVELDEPVRALLPDGTRVPTRDGAEITLRHLATHTSGLPRLPKGMLRLALLHPRMPDPYAGCTADVLLPQLAHTTLRTTPGQRSRYSNLGAGLLGLALANRAGTDYETLIVRSISEPLGLHDTRITLDVGQQDRFAQGYNRGRKPVAHWNLADLAGAGGLRSTVTDLLAFARAQLDGGTGELAAAIELTRGTKHRLNDRSWVHLGWMGVRLHPRVGAHTLLWHNGATAGFFAWIGLVPAERVAVVMLSNTARPVDRVAFELLRALLTGSTGDNSTAG
jgi:CubicO group peptidase (beta-lactamase class C family)